MTSEDQEKFTQGMMVLAEVYNRKLSSLLLHTYWNCLKKYAYAVFEITLWDFLKNPDYAKRGFPSPADWIKAIEGDTASKGLAAWTEIITTIRHIGHYESVIFTDPLIHSVIRDMGGWIFLCQQSERDLIFAQKEFERRYQNYYDGFCFRQTTTGFDNNLLFFSGGFIFSGYVNNTIRINVKGYFDLWCTTWTRRNISQIKTT